MSLNLLSPQVHKQLVHMPLNLLSPQVHKMASALDRMEWQRTSQHRKKKTASRHIPRRTLDGVTGRLRDLADGVAVPRSDGVFNRGQAVPAPSIIKGRPWNTMRVSTSRWKVQACAWWMPPVGLCAKPRLRANRRP